MNMKLKLQELAPCLVLTKFLLGLSNYQPVGVNHTFYDVQNLLTVQWIEFLPTKNIENAINIFRRETNTNLKNAMELVGGVVVEEKGQAWGNLPNWITVAWRQTWKFITENINQERIWWEKEFKVQTKKFKD